MAMTDREMLEYAAKAADIEITWEHGQEFPERVTLFRGHLNNYDRWDPLTDDGDALRLAVRLGFHMEQDWFRPQGGYQPDNGRVRVLPMYLMEQSGSMSKRPAWSKEEYGGDPYAATRRAIVRAAAEIGKAMQEGK